MKRTTVTLLAVSAIAGLVTPATADLIPFDDPAGQTLANGYQSNRLPENTANSSGFDQNASGDWHHTTSGGTMWNTSGGLGWIAYDLGDVYDLDFMHIWNYNEHGGWWQRGAKTVDVYTATTGTLASPDYGAKIGTISIGPGNGTNNYFGHNFKVNAAAGAVPSDYDAGEISTAGFEIPAARFVKFDVQDTHNTASYTGTGLSEVRFFGSATSMPALQYRFDPGSSPVDNEGWVDAVGDAAVSGATMLSGPSSIQSDVLRIDANGEQASTADIEEIDALNEFTLSFWVKPTAPLTDWDDMMGDFDYTAPGAGSLGWALQSMEDGRLRLRMWSDSNSGSFDSLPSALVEDQWRYVTIVAQGLTDTNDPTIDYYLNGEHLVQRTKASSTSILGNSSNGFGIGDVTWDSETRADYAYVQLFARALDAGQVQQIFLSTVPEPATGVLLVLGALGLAVPGRRRARHATTYR